MPFSVLKRAQIKVSSWRAQAGTGGPPVELAIHWSPANVQRVMALVGTGAEWNLVYCKPEAVSLPLEIGWLLMWSYMVKVVSYDVLLTSDSLADVEQYKSIWNHVGGLWTLQRSPPWRSGHEAYGKFFKSLTRNLEGLMLPLWRLFCIVLLHLYNCKWQQQTFCQRLDTESKIVSCCQI